MSVSSYDAVAEKVLLDLDTAIRKDPSINEFYIIPMLEEENKNSSPISKGENTLGLESWIVTHIYPYAHQQILQKSNYKTQNLKKLIPCLTGVALLNPEMPTVWNKRKELILSKKMVPDDELRLTRMALSRKPKCNDVLTHRRWLITEIFRDVNDPLDLLKEELELSEIIANRYHSNYHAWSHRMWAIQNLLPDPFLPNVKKKSGKFPFFASLESEPSYLNHQPIAKADLISINNCPISKIYFDELESNLKWISSHVSDHSGMHFRTFLLSEILTFIKRFLSATDKMKFQTSCYGQNNQSFIIPPIFTNGKKNLLEFFSCFPLSDALKKAIEDYFLKLDDEVTLVDLALFLIVTELKSNHSLCLIFSNHEALWCYRKFLVHSFKAVMNAFDSQKSNSDGENVLHQDEYGVPCRKDFKYDDTNEQDSSLEHSNLYLALYLRVMSCEEEFISKASLKPESANNLIQNYANWLKHCFREDLKG